MRQNTTNSFKQRNPLDPLDGSRNSDRFRCRYVDRDDLAFCTGIANVAGDSGISDCVTALLSFGSDMHGSPARLICVSAAALGCGGQHLRTEISLTYIPAT